MKEKHINDVQTTTVDEHYELLLKEKKLIDSKLINVTPDDLPHWYDKKLFKEGQNYYKRNILAVVMTSFLGLFTIISNPDILRVINMIHGQHTVNNKKSLNANIGGIYEEDIALTQFVFLGYILTTPKSIGLRNTVEEEKAFIHFWRVVGYMLGIPDRLNICRKNVKETRELCQKISSGILANYLNEAPSDFYSMVSSIIREIWYIDLTLDKDALLALIYRLHGIKYNVPLKWYSWLKMNYRDLIFRLYLVPYIGTIMRLYQNYMFMFILWILQKWSKLADIIWKRKLSN